MKKLALTDKQKAALKAFNEKFSLRRAKVKKAEQTEPVEQQKA